MNVEFSQYIKDFAERLKLTSPEMTQEEAWGLAEYLMEIEVENYLLKRMESREVGNALSEIASRLKATNVDTSTFRGGIGKGITKAVSITTQDIIKHYRMLQEEEEDKDAKTT